MSGQFFLWLLPPDSVHDRFAALIGTLSRRLGTSAFTPHLTLIGSVDLPELDVVSRAAALAADLPPPRIHLTRIEWSDAFYRCLFIRAETTAALQAAHRTASACFGRSPEPAFMPHLSLVYGSIPTAEKERIAAEIGPLAEATFVADRLVICFADGPPERWRTIHAFPLTGHPPGDPA
jgi:2'-5' RNA ligase